MWGINSAYRVKCFLNLIFIKYFYKNTQNVDFDYVFHNKKKSGQPLPVHQRQCHMFSWLGGQLESRQPFRDPHVHLHSFVCCRVDVFLMSALTDNFWSKSSWKSWLRTFSVSYFARVAQHRPTCLKRTNKDCFPLLSSASWEDPVASFSEHEKLASSRQYSQWAASFQHLELTHIKLFLVQTNKKYRRGGKLETQRNHNWHWGHWLGTLWTWNWAGHGERASERRFEFSKSLNTRGQTSYEAIDWKSLLCKALEPYRTCLFHKISAW